MSGNVGGREDRVGPVIKYAHMKLPYLIKKC